MQAGMPPQYLVFCALALIAVWSGMVPVGHVDTSIAVTSSCMARALPGPTGEELYQKACAACHGADGRGTAAALLGFDTALPDFTDCSFATREPDADWIAVAHQGGPVRGFAQEMPAFGDALSEAELQAILDFIRTLCDDSAWPRGELNLPRALITEKAFPEDEAVFTIEVKSGDKGAVIQEVTYEKRIGARSQIEMVVPFGFGVGEGGGRLGDVALGWKRVTLQSLSRGSILALGGELLLPTGHEPSGLGTGTMRLEPFVSFGQSLPADAFIQLFGGVAVDLHRGTARDKTLLRGVFGKTFTQGRWGRAWSPMVEVLGSGSQAGLTLDFLPQAQVTLNQRQHVVLNVGVRIPSRGPERSVAVMVYLLWEWFDGGFLEGW